MTRTRRPGAYVRQYSIRKALELIREGRRIARDVERMTEPDASPAAEPAVPKKLAKR